MNIGRGIFGGALGGLVGAVIWAGISSVTGYEIGWIAWGVGGLVGLGCVWASKGQGNLLGSVAVVITILSILAGKYFAVEFSIRNEIGSEQGVLQSALAEIRDDEVTISYLADQIIEERQAMGDVIQWPAGVNPDEATRQSDYPPAIWSRALSTWEAMSPEEREEYRGQLAEQIQAGVQAFFSDVSASGFLNSFGPMDLLFFGLAVATAFKIAARGSTYDTKSDAGADAGQTETR